MLPGWCRPPLAHRILGYARAGPTQAPSQLDALKGRTSPSPVLRQIARLAGGRVCEALVFNDEVGQSGAKGL